MDEPMDEGEQANHQVQDDKKNKCSSILRPGSMVMMTITVEDYESQYWPKLENAINQLLTMTPGDYIPISYEQMYSCVYKCVCKQFSERLYRDLIQQMTAHLEKMCLELQACMQEPCVYINKFNFAQNQYIQALGGIVPIFNYMNRFYIESKLKTDLNLELRKLFTIHVAEKHIHTLIPLLVEAQDKPFAIAPPTMASILKNLHSLKPDFAQLQPQLFAKYIPNVLPPTTESDLDKYIEETRRMQEELLKQQGFTRGDQSRKRPGEDDLLKGTPLNFLPPRSSAS